MKKLILFIVFTVICFSAMGQVGVRRWYAGEDTYLYVGAKFILNKEYKDYNSLQLYSSLDAATNENGSQSLSLDEIKDLKLFGFKIHEIDYATHIIELKQEDDHLDHYFLRYNTTNSYNFWFDVEGINYDLEKICSSIEIKEDKFEKSIIKKSPHSITRKFDVYQTISLKKIENVLYLECYGPTVNVGVSGVKILLEDGSIIEKDSEVDVEATSNGYNYSSYVALDKDDMKILSEKRIVRFRLFVYDGFIFDHDSNMIRSYIRCLNFYK